MIDRHHIAIVRIDRILSAELEAEATIDKIVDIVNEIKRRDHAPVFLGMRIRDEFIDPWEETDDMLCKMTKS